MGPRRKLSRLEVDFASGDRLDEPPVSMDSLEALEIAGAVNEMFELHRTGLEDNLLRHRTLDRWIDVVVRSWEAHPEGIVFRTSGSTGEPKKVRHPSAFLAREVEAHAEHFGDRRRIGTRRRVHEGPGRRLERRIAADCVDRTGRRDRDGAKRHQGVRRVRAHGRPRRRH
ncbi:MAG: hypothetical protein ACLFTV_16990, partial [Desulfococcaceae bacterium]